MSVILTGGQIFNPDTGSLEPADVLIEGAQIAAVAPGLSATAAESFDPRDMILIPGLVNAHTHGHNNLSRGLADRWTLEEQLNYGFALQANRTPEDQYLSAAVGAIEMLKTGCTTACDLFMAVPAPDEEVLEAVVQAYTDVGLRAVIAPSAADLSFHQSLPRLSELLPPSLRRSVESFRADPAARLLEIAALAIRRWHGSAGGRITVAVAPSIPTQCSDDFLTGAARLAREHGVGFHTHLAESRLQTHLSGQRWGCSIVERLDQLEALGPRFTGAHGVWLSRPEMVELASSGSALVHNPASNLRLGVGVAPIRELLDRGVCVALGTDGSLSSDNQNMFESMRFAALVSRAAQPQERERWLEARKVWRMATISGATATGMGADIGRIEPGRKADVVLLRSNSLYLRPVNNPLNSLVFAETGAAVESAFVDGQLVLHRGRVLGVDEASVRNRAQATCERLAARDSDAWALAAALSGYVTQACAVTLSAASAKPTRGLSDDSELASK